MSGTPSTTRSHLEISTLLVAQYDRRVGGADHAKRLGVNGLQQGRTIELAGDGLRQLEEHRQLVDLAAVLLVELGVLERERRLVAEGLEQPHLGLREDPARDVAQRECADDPPLRPERHREHRARARVPHRRGYFVAQDDRGIAEDVGRRDGAPLGNRDPGRPDSRGQNDGELRDFAKATPAREGHQRAVGLPQSRHWSTRTTWTASSCGSRPPSADGRRERVRRRTTAPLARRSDGAGKTRGGDRRGRASRRRDRLGRLDARLPRDGLGTAKPTAEQRARVPHHLLDVAEPSELFSVARYQELAREAIAEIRGRGRRVLLVGGSALYERAVVDDLGFPGTDADIRKGLEAEAAMVGATGLHERLAASDPAAAARIEPGNVRRTVRALEVAELTGQPFSSFAGGWDVYEPHRVRAAGISVSGPALRARIETRVTEMLERGWLDEVRTLVERGFGSWLTSAQAIGYAELARHLAGEITLDEAIVGTVKRTRALARRQLAFFRRDPRIRWFEAGEAGAEPLVEDVAAYLSGRTWETADG